MATISISVSTKYKSEISVSMCHGKNDLLSVDFTTYLPFGGSYHLYDKSFLQLHGTGADLRRLAELMIEATEPPEPEPECECVRTDVDAVDARGCSVHCTGGLLGGLLDVK